VTQIKKNGWRKRGCSFYGEEYIDNATCGARKEDKSPAAKKSLSACHEAGAYNREISRRITEKIPALVRKGGEKTSSWAVSEGWPVQKRYYVRPVPSGWRRVQGRKGGVAAKGPLQVSGPDVQANNDMFQT